MPFPGAFGIKETGEHRGKQHRENQAAGEREGDGPGHGFEETPLDALQSEDRDVGRDDNTDRIKHGPLDFVRGFRDLLARRFSSGIAISQMADDIFHHHHRAFHHHAEIERAQREQIRGNAFELEAGGGEQQREGDSERNDEGSADIAEEDKQHDRDEDDSFCQIVHDGVGGEMHQVAAIEEGDDGHARRQEARMTVRSIELLYFFVNGFEGGVAFGAFFEQHDSFNDVAVIQDVAVQFMNGFAVAAEADFRALRDQGDVPDANPACHLSSKRRSPECRPPF